MSVGRSVPSGGGRLGTIAKYDSTRSNAGLEASGLVDRYAIQSEARHLLPWERVSRCSRWLIPGASTVEVLHYPSLDRAGFANLMICGSVWLCGVCASRITEQRRNEIASALSYGRAHNLRWLMESYTASHQVGQALKPWLAAFDAAWRRFSVGRRAADLRAHFGVVGSIRAQEVTYGRAGFHPHIHRLVAIPQEVDSLAYANAARAQWAAATARSGLYVNEHGYAWSDTNVTAASYVAKWSHDRTWDESHELSKWQVKRGREGGYTPFDLLRGSLAGQGEYGDRFREYASAFKGRRQLHWSPGLKELCGVVEVSDQEAAEAPLDTLRESLGWLSRDQWRVILANDARADVLAAARSGGWAGVAGLLGLLCAV